MKKILPYLFLVISLSSCELAEIESYTGLENIYFNEYDIENNELVADTSTYTLRGSAGPYIDVPLAIQVQGIVSDLDRPYLLSADPGAGTAQEGVDYTILEEDFIIEAGAYTDTIYIRIYNNNLQEDITNFLVLQLQPNTYFSTNFAWDHNDAGEPTASRIRHTIAYGDIALEPLSWASLEQTVFGEFSSVKVDLLVEIAGLEEGLIYTADGEADYTLAELLLAASLVQAYLEEQAALGNIIRDENGNIIEMGSSI